MKQLWGQPGTKRLLALAILLRVLIMPFFFHPDIKTYHYQASFLKQGEWNIYSYLVDNKEKLPLKEEFVYFPLTYLFLGGYQAVVSPLLGEGFDPWLADASGRAVESIGTYRYLFTLKLPYLIFDILSAFFLVGLFTKIKNKEKAFKLWLFNPFSLVLIYFYSNLDIIPVFLIVVSLVLAKKDKIILSAVLLAVAAGFKAYPLMFLPLLLLYSKSIKQALLAVIASLATLLLIITPFWSSAFQSSALVSGLTTRMTFSQIGIGFGESLMVAVVAISALFFYAFVQEEKLPLWKYHLVLLLLLFSFIHFHIQWLLWTVPFVILLIVENKRIGYLAAVLVGIAVLIPLLYQDRSMSVSLLSPYSLLFNQAVTPATIVQKFYNPLDLQSILHSSLAGGTLVLIYRLFQNRQS